MGFLLGAYGKLMAGKRVRQLQARMMSVQSQLRRATRDVENMEKYFTRMEKDAKNNMSLWGSSLVSGMQASQMFSNFKTLGIVLDPMDPNAMQTGMAALQEKAKTDSSIWNAFSGLQNMNTGYQQGIQSMVMSMQSNLESQIEMQKELQLQPLKDLEEDLQLEKDSLESQIQIANADYDACKEMEKAGVKSLTPQYTGQG